MVVVVCDSGRVERCRIGRTEQGIVVVVVCDSGRVERCRIGRLKARKPRIQEV